MAVSRDEISKKLIDELRLDSGRTWADAAADSKLRRIAAAGMIYLNEKLGAPQDYESDGDARTLLFEYVRYSRDAALDVFENNYLSLILAAQTSRQVKAYVENTLQAEE